MPDYPFFARRGLFVRPAFLPPPAGARLIALAARGSYHPAGVAHLEERKVDPAVRSTGVAEAGDALVELLTGTLSPALAEIEAWHGSPLRIVGGPDLLRYLPGDHYLPHRDRGDHGAEPSEMRARRVSLVLFLNGQSAGPRECSACGFGGGELVFFGLAPGAAWTRVGFPLRGETGLLVAFPSELVHEVRPVEWGERYTVVCWLG